MPTTLTFAPDVAAQLAGPSWLSEARTAAAERFASATMPTFEEEIWRYTPIDDLDLSRFSLVTEPAAAAALPDGIPEQRAALVVCRNGAVVSVELDPAMAAKGVVVDRVADASQGEAVVASAEGADLFADLNLGFAADPILIDIPANLVVEDPIVIVSTIDIANSAVFPRISVRSGANSEARIVEMQLSTDIPAFSAPVVDLTVEPSARLGYLVVQDLGPQVWQIGSQTSTVDSQATLTSAVAALGGAYARLRTDCRMIGRGAHGNLLAVYFGESSQTLDFRTFQDHVAPDTTSNLLFKGALSDASRSVYSGLIRVRPDARGTNAYQTNRNIKLSEEAWAESVPNLEIETNDVKCSHASTVGPIDEEQRFYLESRGVPPVVAERLIVQGFFDEVLDQLPVAAVADGLRAAVLERLLRREQS